MSRVKNNNSKKKNTKKIRNFILVAVILAVSVMASYVYFTTQKWNNVIFPNVKVENVDLTGKTKEEAIKLLRDKYGNPALKSKINIKAENRTYTINFSGLNAQYNIIKTVNEAYAYGKDLNIISKYKLISKPDNKQYNLKFSYNEKPINDTIESMKKEINKGPKEPSIKLDNGKFVVIDGNPGAELDGDKLKKDIMAQLDNKSSGDINIDAPIKTINSKTSTEALKAVDTNIATISSNYSTSSWGRSTNIAVATKSIDGTLLMPGETFSFNEVVGERTKARGYQEAPVIINQKVEPGLGGGICQVSTALYNAVLQANLKTTERVHHTFPSHYAAKGLDATVDWGNIDLKFKNTFDYPVYIQAYTKNKTVYFNIYSNKKLKERTYKITTELYSTVEPTIKYIDDPTLLEGKHEVVKNPHTGYRVKVYRDIYENGKFIKKELVSKDYYVAINGITKRGTKKH
ncbi:VanW family protein [Clostridium ganghwense]|uniref:VanW family protein n=1 Tax=Clostridium ganghwense TaxID=312089 RepID=A0ABT4CNE0_9CLOT|nr:VanW family protein [Clostridium ganghwense]MCY6369731.1 VanW family protein [Clostridium ganghwense]